MRNRRLWRVVPPPSDFATDQDTLARVCVEMALCSVRTSATTGVSRIPSGGITEGSSHVTGRSRRLYSDDQASCVLRAEVVLGSPPLDLYTSALPRPKLPVRAPFSWAKGGDGMLGLELVGGSEWFFV